jgi:Holliday junction resolvase
MPSRSKQKGNRFEREVVNIAKENNLKSERAYGSDGRALGENKEVDVIIDSIAKKWRIQVKVRKKIAQWIKPDSKSVDLQVVKEDRGEIYAVLPYKSFIDLVVERDYLLENSEEFKDSAREREQDELEYHRNRRQEIENAIKESL